MQTFACAKCGSANVYIECNGTQTGLYCDDCGKWIKWLGKDERRLAERWIENNKKSMIDEDTEELISLTEQKEQNIKQLIENIKSNIKELEELLET